MQCAVCTTQYTSIPFQKQPKSEWVQKRQAKGTVSFPTGLSRWRTQTSVSQTYRWVYNIHTHTYAGTDFDIGALRLHQFADDFAEFVGIGQLAWSGVARRERGRLRAGWRRDDIGWGIHFVQTAAESCDLLCTLQREKDSHDEWDISQSCTVIRTHTHTHTRSTCSWILPLRCLSERYKNH